MVKGQSVDQKSDSEEQRSVASLFPKCVIQLQDI